MGGSIISKRSKKKKVWKISGREVRQQRRGKDRRKLCGLRRFERERKHEGRGPAS